MQASSSRVAKAEQAASCTRLLESRIRFSSSDISGFRYWGRVVMVKVEVEVGECGAGAGA